MRYKKLVIFEAEKDFIHLTSNTNFNYVLSASPDKIRSEKSGLLNLFLNLSTPLGFCLDLRGFKYCSKTEQKEIEQFIVLLTFTANYLKSFGSPVICILRNHLTNPEEFEKMAESICLMLKSQGHDELSCYRLEEGNDGHSEANEEYKLRSAISLKQSDWVEYFKEAAENYSIHSPLLFMSISSLSEFTELCCNLDLAQKDFSANNETLYRRIDALEVLRTERLMYKAQAKALWTQLDGGKNSLNLLRRDAQINVDWFKQENEKIKIWYQKEYEELRGWFKKLGHILKQFRSPNKEV